MKYYYLKLSSCSAIPVCAVELFAYNLLQLEQRDEVSICPPPRGVCLSTLVPQPRLSLPLPHLSPSQHENAAARLLGSILEQCLHPRAPRGSEGLCVMGIPTACGWGDLGRKHSSVVLMVVHCVTAPTPALPQSHSGLHPLPLNYLSLKLSRDQTSRQSFSIPSGWRALLHTAPLIILCI